jgi:UDPglucose 6-dehydrogenase
VVSEIARTINGYKVIAEKSTVPVYTNEWIHRVLHRVIIYLAKRRDVAG